MAAQHGHNKGLHGTGALQSSQCADEQTVRSNDFIRLFVVRKHL